MQKQRKKPNDPAWLVRKQAVTKEGKNQKSKKKVREGKITKFQNGDKIAANAYT